MATKMTSNNLSKEQLVAMVNEFVKYRKLEDADSVAEGLSKEDQDRFVTLVSKRIAHAYLVRNISSELPWGEYLGLDLDDF